MVDDGELYKRIGALEAKVEHLYRHLVGLEGGSAVIPPMPSVDSTLSPAVRELVRQGDTIGAIRQYRAETGVDLAVAKQAIDGLRGA